jgi:hypothetical protein
MYEGERGYEVMSFVSLHTQIPSHFNLGRDRVRNCSLVNSEFMISSKADDLHKSILFHFKYSKCNYQNPITAHRIIIYFTDSSLWMQKAVQYFLPPPNSRPNKS